MAVVDVELAAQSGPADRAPLVLCAPHFVYRFGFNAVVPRPDRCTLGTPTAPPPLARKPAFLVALPDVGRSADRAGRGEILLVDGCELVTVLDVRGPECCQLR